jgi:hypothetical protein
MPDHDDTQDDPHAGLHLHGELFHEHADAYAFGFRCTLCHRSIGKPLTKAELGLAEDEEFQAGKMYRYDKCYCGFGRFVIAERTYIDPEELHRHMAEHMQH